MADEIFNQCGTRIIDVANSCDGSLTKADIQGLTPGTLESLKDTAFMEFFLYRQATMARLSGVKENALWDLMMSRVKNVKDEVRKESIGPNKSYFLPYFLREQEDHINANAFKIEAGVPDPLAGTTPAGEPKRHDGAFVITVSGSDSPFYTDITHIERYFLPGEYVIVLNLSGSSAAQEPYFKVVNAVHFLDGGIEKAQVVIEPNVTDAGWAALSGAEQAVFQPTAGVVMLGTNSISDYESWCHNQPADLSKRLIAHWPQTSRYTRCWDDLYEEYLKRIFAGDVNPWIEKFKELPMSEQNRRMFAIYQKKLMNSFWWGQAIDENQTVEGYRSLPGVYDPKNPNKFIEYKSNMIGVKPQLQACNRVIDFTGAPLDVNILEEQLYALKRHREVDGGTVDSIDVMTDKGTANRFKTLMAHYYKARYGLGWERQFKSTEKITFGQQTMWNFNSYEFDDAHVVLNVIVEPFFADYKAHFTGGLASRGNQMLFIDWNDLHWGVAKTNSRTSHTPDVETDPDFKCVIEANIEHTEMESITSTAMIDDPKRHLIIENFSDDCPTYNYQPCEATPTP